MTQRIGIFDYGVGNLRSVANAIAHIGAEPVVSSDPAVLSGCDRAILPGVGAFAHGMAALQERALIEAVGHFSRAGKPLLGICLGMQMLGESSSEFGHTPGLGLIEGRAERLAPPDGALAAERWRLPNVGWLPVRLTGTGGGLAERLVARIARTDRFYFVHSYALPALASTTLATSCYCGAVFAAIVARDSIVGTQFHPEKSGPAGLAFLKHFCELQ